MFITFKKLEKYNREQRTVTNNIIFTYTIIYILPVRIYLYITTTFLQYYYIIGLSNCPKSEVNKCISASKQLQNYIILAHNY